MESWDIYDRNRIPTGRKHIRDNPLNDGEYHVIVHVWIINNNGNIVLTKRHPNKRYPDLWECTAGSLLSGESSLDGAIREVREEIGVTLQKQSGKLIYNKLKDGADYFYDVWVFYNNMDIRDVILQKNEVTDIQLVTFKEFLQMYKSNEIVDTLSYFPELVEKRVISIYHSSYKIFSK